jgi:cellobiose phosphorylase
MAAARMGDAQLAWRLFGLINPLRHANSAEALARYRVEPYVVAADVYALAGEEGRGGWTWYTGAAGWMYRLLSEELLGLQIAGEVMSLRPLVPHDWRDYRFHYRYHGTLYHVQVQIVGQETWNVRSVTVDGAEQGDCKVHMVDDHVDHQVVVRAG